MHVERQREGRHREEKRGGRGAQEVRNCRLVVASWEIGPLHVSEMHALGVPIQT